MIVNLSSLENTYCRLAVFVAHGNHSQGATVKSGGNGKIVISRVLCGSVADRTGEVGVAGCEGWG